MMTNLFSIFDPSSSVFYAPLNWLSLPLGLFLFSSTYWVTSNPMSSLMKNMKLGLTSEMLVLLKKFSPSVGFLIPLFLFILFNNLLGLLPFIFTPTSHLSITLPLALSLWMGYFLFGWINNTQHTLSHLVPQGTPSLLMPLMVLIESVSSLIRPLTLSIRLMANMVAGHLLLALAGEAATIFSLQTNFKVILTQIMMYVLELAVACIQAYVFTILTTLYISEV